MGTGSPGALCVPSSLSSPGQSSPPPSASNTSSWGPSWSCICLRPCFGFLSQNPGAPGRGQKDWPGGKGRENWREGKLEQTTLGPELGVSGTAPTASILSNYLTTGQNLWADFYFRKKGEMKS